ncbi:MAG: hypothetical protein P4L34_05800 [Paludibacter sp.]|nr:hypothetical protein [Paludibacter sp.]
MKARLFILLGLIALAFTACDLGGSVNNTPIIYFVTNPINNNTDTLYKYITDQSGVYRMDTVSVGDTVNFHMLLYGYSNNLTSYYVTVSDTTCAKILLPPTSSLDSVFLSSSSNYSNGKFVFKNKITSLYFPFKYVVKKVSNDEKITFVINSDANFNSIGGGGNSFSFILQTPIIPDTTKIK